jgi:hypothetical protein
MHKQRLIMSMIEFLLTKPNRVRLVQAFSKISGVELPIDCEIERQTARANVDDPTR